MTNHYWGKVLQFVHRVYDKLDIGKDRAQAGILTFTSYPSFRCSFTKSLNKNDFKDCIDGLNYIGKKAYIASGLQKARHILTSSAYGQRVNTRNVVIVVATGNTYYESQTAKYARQLRDYDETEVYAVGFGYHVKESQVRLINSDDKYLHYPDSLSKILDLGDEISDDITDDDCDDYY